MVQGHRMWLDDKDTLELGRRGIYEPTETDLLKRELKPGQTFVDIGANIGYYTLIAARLVGPAGRVFAFEPDPANFALLKKNVERNGYDNVVLVGKAVSDRTRSARLYRSETNRGDHRLYDSRDGRKSLRVQAAALDDFFLNRDKTIHLIKMDIQGAEAAALAGMKALVRKNRRLKLITEFSPTALKNSGSKPSQYLKNLGKMGFKFWEISEKEKSLRLVKPPALLNRPWTGADDYTNLFCVKNGKGP